MKVKASYFYICLALFFVTVAGSLFWGSRELVSPKSSPTAKKLELAQELQALKEPVEALRIVAALFKEPRLSQAEELAAVQIAIDAAAQLKEVTLLTELYESYPKLFYNKEVALLQVASLMVADQNKAALENLMLQMGSNEKKSAAWSLLEADILLLNGKNEEAQSRLKEPFSEHESEVARLLRLSLLDRFRSPKNSWKYLEEAFSLAPNDPMVRLQRAFFLEQMDKVEMAGRQFAALIEDPSGHPSSDLLTQEVATEKLVSLFFNKALIESGIQRFPDIVSRDRSPEVLEKALFFEKVIAPLAIHVDDEALSTSKNGDYIRYLSKLPAERFWDEGALPPTLSKAATPSAFWLRLLERIRLGDEKGAYEMTNIASNEEFLVNPELFDGIKLRTEEAQKMGDSIDRTQVIVLLGNQGWSEALLLMGGEKGDYKKSPKVNLLVASALRQNRGLREAILFLEKEGLSGAEKLRLARYYEENQLFEKATALLTGMAQEKGNDADEAQVLLAQLQLRQKKLKEAFELVKRSSLLESDVVFQEKIAKEALSQKNEGLSQEIYRNLGERSEVAIAFLAKEAYQNKDFKKSYQLTLRLLEKNPSSKTLQQNLKKIEMQLNHKP